MNERKKILLIEDDDFIARAYKVGLEREGFEIEIASDGAQGFAAIKRDGHALILLDIILPKMDGFEVLQKLKEEPHSQTIPVIILSNLGQDSDVERGKALGAVDYLVKANTSMDEVVKKVREQLS